MSTDDAPAAEGACPATESLCGLVEGRLDPALRAALEQHLDSCPSCRSLMVELGKGGSSMSSSLGPHELPASTPARAARSAPPPSPTLPPASGAVRVGRYEIRREVGAGGMGVVYEAWDPSLDRRVAIKLIRPDKLLPGSASDRRARMDQLAAEARALAKVSHPNVLTIFDVGVEVAPDALGGDDAGAESVFLAMEFVEGVTMDKGFAHRARAWRDRVEPYVQVGRALAAVHEAGLMHRDVKPANILLGHDGRVKLTDFGLAAKSGDNRTLAGTPAYMAPEQLKGQASPAADQYALAMCVVEALLGTRVLPGASADELLKKGCAQWPDDAPSRALWQALARALAVDPHARHPDVGALCAALEAELGVGRAARARRAPWLAPLVGLAVLGGGVAVWAASGGREATSSDAPSRAATSSAATADGAGATPDPSAGSSAPAPSVGEAAAPRASAGASSAPSEATASPSGSAPLALGGKTLATAAASAPGGSDGLPPSPPIVAAPTLDAVTNAEASELYKQAAEALRSRDGKKCIQLLDKAAAKSAIYDEPVTRGQCEMLAGRCDTGAKRLAAARFPETAIDTLKRSSCPVSAQTTPADRLKAVWLQAALPPYSTAKCEKFLTDANKAIADHGSDKPDGTASVGARSNIALCFAGANDCARAAQLARSIIGGGDEERVTKWIRQLHPNCAGYGGGP